MNNILTEIRSRRLWQTLIVYCGGGFGLMQVVDILLNRFGLSTVYFNIFLVLLIAGIPGSLVIAWFHGKEGAQKIEKLEVILQSLLLAIALLISYRIYASGPTSPTSLVSEKSVAVLPFVDMSQNRDQEYFSDGLSEELLNLLSKNPNLKVICRTSSFSFRGKDEDVRTIGEKLGVANVVEGSVQKSGNKVRITAELINAIDGTSRWSETFDRTMDDIFKVQDEIAGTVVQELKAALLNEQEGGSPAPRNMEAYNLFLLGRYFLQRGGEENIARSIDTFKKALSIDSTDAQVWTELAKAYSTQADFGYASTREGYARARATVRKALLLDSRLADAHEVMAWISMAYDWDWPAADTEFRSAISLEPGNAETLRNMATLSAILGKKDNAIDVFKKSIALDPLKFGSQASFFFYVFQLFYMNHLRDAKEACTKALESDSQTVLVHVLRGFVSVLDGRPDAAVSDVANETDPNFRLWGSAILYYARGRKDSADEAIQQYEAKYQNVAAYQVGEVYAYRGEADNAFRWLDRAYMQRDGGLLLMKCDPFLNNIRRDARYSALLSKMKLPE